MDIRIESGLELVLQGGLKARHFQAGVCLYRKGLNCLFFLKATWEMFR